MTIADINAEARSLVDADTTTYTAADLLRRINAAYEEITSFILGLDGLWQFDDTNFTDFPEGRTTLVASQQDYTIPVTYLEIEGVSVLNSNGDFAKLTPIDRSQMGIDPAEFFSEAGMPIYYDLSGRSIILYPAPAAGSVTLTNGLKIFYKRTSDNYTSGQVTTGTKEPGFASPFHVILAYMAALPYAQAYKQDRVPMITAKITELKDGLSRHYGRREQDRRKRLSMSGISSR